MKADIDTAHRRRLRRHLHRRRLRRRHPHHHRHWHRYNRRSRHRVGTDFTGVGTDFTANGRARALPRRLETDSSGTRSLTSQSQRCMRRTCNYQSISIRLAQTSADGHRTSYGHASPDDSPYARARVESRARPIDITHPGDRVIARARAPMLTRGGRPCLPSKGGCIVGAKIFADADTDGHADLSHTELPLRRTRRPQLHRRPRRPSPHRRPRRFTNIPTAAPTRY